MRPPIASLLLSLSLVLSPVLAMQSAANPQLGESTATDPQLDESGATDPQLDELSTADPKFDELQEGLSRRLSERVDNLLSELASAALDQQIEELADRRATRVTSAPDDGGRMKCRAPRDSKFYCVVVAMRSEAPASDALTTTQP